MGPSFGGQPPPQRHICLEPVIAGPKTYGKPWFAGEEAPRLGRQELQAKGYDPAKGFIPGKGGQEGPLLEKGDTPTSDHKGFPVPAGLEGTFGNTPQGRGSTPQGGSGFALPGGDKFPTKKGWGNGKEGWGSCPPWGKAVSWGKDGNKNGLGKSDYGKGRTVFLEGRRSRWTRRTRGGVYFGSKV